MVDPNETLGRLRVALREFRGNDDGSDHSLPMAWARTLATQAEELDEWLSNGGFLPAPWNGSGRPLPPLIEPLGPPNPADGHLPEGDAHG
jgi:hypothetical protein